jgi:serine/threonine-protein kinase RsbT
VAQTARKPENEIAARILLLLRRYLSELTANSLLDSALERSGLQAARLQQSDIVRLLPALERGARLFMRNQADVEETLAALQRLASAPEIRSSAPEIRSSAPEIRSSAPEIRLSASPPAASVAPPGAEPARRPPSGSLWPRSEPPTARRPLPDPGGRSDPPPVRRPPPELGSSWAPEARTEPKIRLPEPTLSPAEQRAAREAPRPSPAQVQGPAFIVQIHREDEIVRARGEARRMAERLGGSVSRQTQLATAVSELARNIFLYAGGRGAVELALLAPPLRGVDVVARDQGPGIADIALVLDGNYRSKLGMGLGLRGVRRLASYFEVNSVVGAGTVVRAQFRIDPGT